NDGQSPACDVLTIPRPTVLSMECDQEFPAYTRLKPAHRPLNDLSLLADSKLKLKATATKSLQTAALKFVGASVNLQAPLLSASAPWPVLQNVPMELLPLTVAGGNRTELAGSFTVPPKGLAGFSVLLLDTEGMESKDSAVYRIDTIPDKPPVVRVTYPDRKEEMITRQALMPVAFEVADDFEIARVRLRYKVDTVEEGAQKTV